ncbi:MAG: WXG100 family type VII secretion target [Corynebacterium sp.]|nr:WXG100 family type VII secretion target [Corynebacterium sp.]
MTDNSRLKVDHGAVSDHAKSLQEHHQALIGQSNRFLEVIAPLEETWKGTSFGSWDAMTQAWHESMEQVNSALGELGSRVDTAGQEYRTGEEEQTQQLQHRLGQMEMPQGHIL